MFNANYFTYDGVYSGRYGLRIADFDDNPVVETEAFSPKLSLIKAPSSLRFYHGGINYDTAPTTEVSIISQDNIPGALRSKILSWLVGKKQFLPLQIHEGDQEGFTFYCVFTSASIIYVNGQCHGFRLVATFDSPFARGTPTEVKVTGTGVVTETEILITNNSDITDGYTYPTVVIDNYNNPFHPSDNHVSIYNSTDNVSRAFTYDDIESHEIITINNELNTISSNYYSQEKLSNFNKNWLRLRKGVNRLQVYTPYDVTITCPYYAMIGY